MNSIEVADCRRWFMLNVLCIEEDGVMVLKNSIELSSEMADGF